MTPATGPGDDAPRAIQPNDPPTLHAPRGYSHVAIVRARTLVFVAGQVALDPTGTLVGPGDLRAQAEQVFRNLGAALAAAGATFRDVAKLTYFLRDIGHLPEVRAVRDRYLDAEHPPTSTAVAVTALFRPDALLEVEAVAALP
ncbi:MAG TPA: RidA family protein [Thermoplasmata archaeon]|nr:RidA family protein [Thermoplasmata archaeon]